jgi:hypothetical protein
MEKCVPLQGIFDDKRSYLPGRKKIKIEGGKRHRSPSLEIGDEAYTKHIDHAYDDYDHATGDRLLPLCFWSYSAKSSAKFLSSAPMISPEMKRKR